MDLKRLWRPFRLYTARNRNEYLRNANIFADFGENSTMSSRRIPLYPELISIGHNVRLAAGVHLVTHDMVHCMLNHREGETAFREWMGCIRIDDNVFIGSNVTILGNVHIGSNVVIGSGTLVNKDLPGGLVYAGVPARPIAQFSALVEKRRATVRYPEGFKRRGDSIPPDFAEWLWSDFYRSHGLSIPGKNQQAPATTIT